MRDSGCFAFAPLGSMRTFLPSLRTTFGSPSALALATPRLCSSPAPAAFSAHRPSRHARGLCRPLRCRTCSSSPHCHSRRRCPPLPLRRSPRARAASRSSTAARASASASASSNTATRGLEKVLAKGTRATLFEVDRSTNFELTTTASLTLMSDRLFEYEGDGTFSSLTLRRQSWLGEGLELSAAALFPDGMTAPAAPRIIASTAAPTGPAGLARSDEGRKEQQDQKQDRKSAREAKRRTQEQMAQTQLAAWRGQARTYRCGDSEGGCPGCDRVFVRRGELKKHFERGRADPNEHRSGLVRGYRAGAPVGRENTADQLSRLVAAQASTIVAHGGEGVAPAACSLCDAEELEFTLCNGSSFTPTEPAIGHAGATRLPTRQKTALQLRFARFAVHDIAAEGSEPLHGHEAHELMKIWGTPAVARRWPALDTAAATADGQPHLPRTAVLSPSELVPVLKLSLAEIRRRKRRRRRRRATTARAMMSRLW